MPALCTVDVSGDPTDWFDRLDNERNLQRTLNLLQDSVLLRSEIKRNDQLYKKLESLPTSTQRLLVAWIGRTPRTNRQLDLEPDFKVGLSLEGGDFFESCDNEIFTKAREDEHLLIGDSPSEVWDALVHRLAIHARSVTIYDSYAYKLLEPESGYVLSSLLKVPDLELYLHTDVDKTDRTMSNTKQKANDVLDAWTEYLTINRTHTTKDCVSKVFLYHPTFRDQHDRTLIFKFHQGKVALQFKAGIEEFDQIRLTSAKKLDKSTNETWITQLAGAWDNVPSRQRLKQAEWRGIQRIK
jgi:hypothetical protein